MPTELSQMVNAISPESTVLLLGAGSSIPSQAPSVKRIMETLAVEFSQDCEGYSLSEFVELLEQKTRNRKAIVTSIRTLFSNLEPRGGLLNLPLYDWKSLYTTNYDNLVELAYRKQNRDLVVFSSNFDFTVRGRVLATRLFKLHGTIEKDISDGSTSRLILSDTDYEFTLEYRQCLFDRMRADLAEANIVIIGHSLADPDIRAIIEKSLDLSKQTYSGGRITLIMYTRDDDRALLWEAKGIRVVFASIDQFFAALATRVSSETTFSFVSDDPLGRYPSLQASTFEVSKAGTSSAPDLSKMFNGGPASYADIRAGYTFRRSVVDDSSHFLGSPGKVCAILLGAAGVGKTTAARQLMDRLNLSGRLCWEHQADLPFDSRNWRSLAADLSTLGRSGVLFVDDAHVHLQEINSLIDALVIDKSTNLQIVLASSRANWEPRVKSPALFRFGGTFLLSRLSGDEIEGLITLVDNSVEVRRLAGSAFVGFSVQEKRRRLAERCQADMFVCIRNIFASESFDNIILREYADLAEQLQDVYRIVAALEDIGVRVHRQLIIRLLGISANQILSLLDGLADVVTEYTIDQREQVFGWRGRHPVINAILTKYKFTTSESIVELFDRVIDNIYPTYDIEMRSIRELCNIDSGIARIQDKRVQNRLLRKLISLAPGERVPRHRLIRNLIRIGEFDQARTEIRIFENDFRRDGPIARYSVELMTARANHSIGLMTEDRVAILLKAKELAAAAIIDYPYTVAVFSAYCEVGLSFINWSGQVDVFDEAMAQLKAAEERIGDPKISQLVRWFDRRLASQLVDDRLTSVDGIIE